MRTLVLTDIHANLTALRAVLDTPEAASCDRILSLGDQVNYGPCPRETLRELTKLGARMLLGNHEERFSRLSEPALQGYNWALLHWTHACIGELPHDLPKDVRLGPVLCTHGTPGDPYRLVDEASVGDVLDALPGEITLLLSGHNHITWRVSRGGKTAFNPGSCGMNEAGEGGRAPFGILETAGSEWELKRCTVPYDVREVRRAFAGQECVRVAPELCRVVYEIICTGERDLLLRWVRFVRSVAEEKGLAFESEQAWREADLARHAADGMDSRTFWERS